MPKTSKNHRKSTVTPNEINYIWKMIRKIQGFWILHFHAYLNNLTSLFSPKHDNILFEFIVWIWVWTLSSNQPKPSVTSCISSKHNILTCHDHASYCALHWLCFFFVCRCLSPPSKTCTDDVIDDTDEELYYLRKCQASKTPLFIPIQSYSLAPALFYCIRTTPIHLLLAAVAEPLYPLHDLSLPQ